jgi:hypothetical protein
LIRKEMVNLMMMFRPHLPDGHMRGHMHISRL